MSKSKKIKIENIPRREGVSDDGEFTGFDKPPLHDNTLIAPTEENQGTEQNYNAENVSLCAIVGGLQQLDKN